MKRIIYSLPLAAVLLFTGCEKEQLTPAATGASSQKPKPNVGSSEKSQITITNFTATYSCGAAVCNLVESIPNPPKYNMVQIVSNHGGTTIKYALYEVNSMTGFPMFDVAAKIIEFNCSLAATNYANGYLNNGAKIMVYAMHTSDSAPATIVMNAGGGAFVSPTQITDSDYEFVTLGNYEGAPGCGDPNG